MEARSFRKPRQHFETAVHPPHVTFDDGITARVNLPWVRFSEARWHRTEPDTIYMDIGEMLVVITGHNLGPLFAAIEEHTLKRLTAHPEWTRDRDRELDIFATRIRIVGATSPTAAPRHETSPQLDLNLPSPHNDEASGAGAA